MLKSIKTALQILAPTIDGHEQFIKMPGVAKAALALAKAARVKDAEAASPLPDGLVRHSDAAPATDFTYHTNFAQVEADEQQVNLTRFSLFSKIRGRSPSVGRPLG
jgi:hypothetical protein